MPFERKYNTHTIFKNDDANTYLKESERILLDLLISKIETGRFKDGKKSNSYYVVNLDEPYSQEVFEVIKKGEIKKERSK